MWGGAAGLGIISACGSAAGTSEVWLLIRIASVRSSVCVCARSPSASGGSPCTVLCLSQRRDTTKSILHKLKLPETKKQETPSKHVVVMCCSLCLEAQMHPMANTRTMSEGPGPSASDTQRPLANNELISRLLLITVTRLIRISFCPAPPATLHFASAASDSSHPFIVPLWQTRPAPQPT